MKNRFAAHSRVRLAAALSLVGLVTAALTGCAPPSQDKVDCTFAGDSAGSAQQFGSDVVIIMAPSENFVDFENVLTGAQDVINEAMGLQGARVSIVIADGHPGLIRTIAPKTGDNEDDNAIINRHLMSKLKETYYCSAGDEVHATTDKVTLEPEVDLLAAFNVAAGAFDVSSSPEQRHIVVLSNGLQTTGQYSFADRGVPTESNVGTVVGALDKQGGLPNLTGATVDFVGLGQENSSEPVLNQQTLDGIIAFWSAVVGASGGRMGTILAQVVDGPPSLGSIVTAEVTSLDDACISVAVTEDDGVTFAPGTAEFLDPVSAAAEAAKIADRIAKSACGGDITVTGFVASATPQDEYVFGNPEDAALSQARADAFKGLLIAAGVTSEINTAGAGKGPVNDWDENGRYVEDLGAQNRKIVVSQ